jgi:hypothetical protein
MRTLEPAHPTDERRVCRGHDLTGHEPTESTRRTPIVPDTEHGNRGQRAQTRCPHREGAYKARERGARTVIKATRALS